MVSDLTVMVPNVTTPKQRTEMTSLIGLWALLLQVLGTTAFTDCSSFNYRAPNSSYPYIFVKLTVNLSFANALTACKGIHDNSNLMIARDSYTASLMRSLSPSFSPKWIGLYQANQLVEPAGNWFWIDGSPIDAHYKDWAYYEPSGGAGADCGSSHDMGFHDIACDTSMYALCEVYGKEKHYMRNWI
jgi:hypothetical protein